MSPSSTHLAPVGASRGRLGRFEPGSCMEDRASAELGAWQVLQGLADGRQQSRHERRPTGPGSSYEGTKPQLGLQPRWTHHGEGRVGREGRSSCRESSAGWGRPGYLGRAWAGSPALRWGGEGALRLTAGSPSSRALCPWGLTRTVTNEAGPAVPVQSYAGGAPFAPPGAGAWCW